MVDLKMWPHLSETGAKKRWRWSEGLRGGWRVEELSCTCRNVISGFPAEAHLIVCKSVPYNVSENNATAFTHTQIS